MSEASLSTHVPLLASPPSCLHRIGDLENLSRLPAELALRRAAPYVAHLVEDPEFFEVEICPLMEEARGTRANWYVAGKYEGIDQSFSLQVFVWPPGMETKIHDHSCWGVYCCALGSV